MTLRVAGEVAVVVAVLAAAGVARVAQTGDADARPNSPGEWAALSATALVGSVVALGVRFAIGRVRERRRPTGRHRGPGPVQGGRRPG